MTEPISRLDKTKSGIGRGARGVSPTPAPLEKAEQKQLSKTYTPYKDTEETKKEPGSSGGNVAVYARFRPLNEKEKAMGEA